MLRRAAATLSRNLLGAPPLSVLAPALSGALRVLTPHAPPALQPAAVPAPSLPPASGAAEAPPWLVDVLLMAVPKKRRSYTRKRIRQAGLIRMRGPKPKDTIYTCPVCERMRLPHRVCEREDCKTYFKHRYY